MAYMKRSKYIIINNDDVKEELLNELYDLDTITNGRARKVVYYSNPMSIVMWARYLTPTQIKKYLVEYNEDDVKIDNNNLGI